MNGQDLYEGLRYVDPAMLEEAKSVSKTFFTKFPSRCNLYRVC